jgi:hypothetical protein
MGDRTKGTEQAPPDDARLIRNYLGLDPDHLA